MHICSLQLLTEFLRIMEKTKARMSQFFHQPWDELQQKIIEISQKEDNINVTRMLGLAGEDMSESKWQISMSITTDIAILQL